MKIYLNANNKAHLEALKACGVKNVTLSHRYSYANIDKFRKEFESVFVVAGTKGDPENIGVFLKRREICMIMPHSLMCFMIWITP